jgi:hypothetical protein
VDVLLFTLLCFTGGLVWFGVYLIDQLQRDETSTQPAMTLDDLVDLRDISHCNMAEIARLRSRACDTSHSRKWLVQGLTSADIRNTTIYFRLKNAVLAENRRLCR